MNWKIRSDDGKQAVLDIGDIATVIIRGGYTPPPPPPPPPAGDSTAGRGRGRGGPRTPPSAVWDAMAFQIAPWDAKKVEAELKKRGLNPVADNDGHGFESFRVKDPDGFDIQISNGAYAKARAAAKNKPGLPLTALGVAAPFANTDWHTVWLDHISFGVTNYKESVAWYQTLLGWKPTGDEGSQNETWICDDCGNVIIRGGNPMNTARPMPAVRRASIGHISFGIQPFDPDKTKADLDARGLNSRMDTGTSKDIHDPTALYKSYHTTTPQGFDLQISNGTKENRTVR
jgi:catechol 2,3-dioxygenase-like lactoylglutathione lyase family enzyme